MKKCLLCLALACLLLCAAAIGESALPDGVYAPDDFTFSGGTGRVTIICPRVTVVNGAAVAEIAFSSPNYTRVIVDGVEYAGEHTADSSIFEVPVPLNAEFLLTGTTTAMSRPHDIDYTLRISLGAASGGMGGLTYESSLELSHAEGFTVDYYAGGCALIDINAVGRYLAVPEGMPAPEGLDADVIVLKKPIQNIYLAATSVMALVDRLDALEAVRFSGTRAEGWSVEHAAERMRSGEMLFAGKYSEPDYELLVKEGCGLAVESTMILHAPKVRELLELLGIPVLIDRSSYEPHPLGRMEWIKLYGVLLDREAEAGAFFAEQAAAVEALAGLPRTDKTVAFFYIGTDGQAVVRGASDYIARMIELGGGVNVFADLTDSSDSRAAVSITMEDFYAVAADADYLIYNAAIDKTVVCLDDLRARSALLSDFKAVQNGDVWCAGRDLYQATDCTVDFIEDIHRMLTGHADGMTFLDKLD